MVGGMRRVRGGRHRLAAQRARAAAEAAEREEGERVQPLPPFSSGLDLLSCHTQG